MTTRTKHIILAVALCFIIAVLSSLPSCNSRQGENHDTIKTEMLTANVIEIHGDSLYFTDETSKRHCIGANKRILDFLFSFTNYGDAIFSGKIGKYFIDLPEEIGVHNKNVLAAVKNGDTISIVYDEGIKEVVKNMTREYQIELNQEGAIIYDGERIVGKLPFKDNDPFSELMLKDNK